MFVSKPGLNAWPSKWFMPIKGFFEKVAIDFPILRPIVKHTIKPGPAVAAIPSILFKEVLLFSKAELIIYVLKSGLK